MPSDGTTAAAIEKDGTELTGPSPDVCDQCLARMESNIEGQDLHRCDDGVPFRSKRNAYKKIGGECEPDC